MNGRQDREMNTGRGMRLMLLGLLALCVPASVSARFDESAPQCDRRYGKPRLLKVRGTEQVRWYEKQGFRVETVFNGGRVVEIFYSRAGGGALRTNELEALLTVNAADSQWVKVDQVSEWKERHGENPVSESGHRALMSDLASFILWRRIDGLAEASYDREEGILFIGNSKRLAAERERQAAQRRLPSNLQGF